MSQSKRWAKFLRVVAIAVAALFLVLFAFVQIQQRVLRWRAERLLADIKQIQMGKSTWADAQRFMYRWGRWGRYEGSCTAEECEYQVELQDGLHAFASSFWTDSGIRMRSEGRRYSPWQLRLYALLGGRIVQVYAYVLISHGIIWRKSYSIDTPRNLITEGAGDFLIGDAEGVSSFSSRMDWPLLTKHPEFSIMAAGPCAGCRDGACTVCEMIQSSFTSFADPAIVNEFFNFNLSCITSWFECKEPKDISPDAWRIYTREREEQEKTPIPPDAKSWKRCDTPVEMLGRDYRFALLTEVVSVKTSPDSGLTRYVVTLRGLKSLKNRAPYKAGILKEPLIGWSDTTLPGGIRISDIKPGSRMILLFNDPFDAPDLVLTNADYCSYVPNTDANEAAIQRGIERDKLADVP